MNDGLMALARMIDPVERAVATDPGLWRGLAPRRGSLPREAAEALDGLPRTGSSQRRPGWPRSTLPPTQRRW